MADPVFPMAWLRKKNIRMKYLFLFALLFACGCGPRRSAFRPPKFTVAQTDCLRDGEAGHAARLLSCGSSHAGECGNDALMNRKEKEGLACLEH